MNAPTESRIKHAHHGPPGKGRLFRLSLPLTLWDSARVAQLRAYKERGEYGASGSSIGHEPFRLWIQDLCLVIVLAGMLDITYMSGEFAVF